MFQREVVGMVIALVLDKMRPGMILFSVVVLFLCAGILTPKEMLALGIFGGKYMTDCTEEFPDDWFENAKLCHERHDPELNFFHIEASLPLSVWRAKGWIWDEDPRGWFQWYCRYYMGRRCPDDERQIKRWRAMIRHVAQIHWNCRADDLSCRRKQRQALLNWAYDSRRM